VYVCVRESCVIALWKRIEQTSAFVLLSSTAIFRTFFRDANWFLIIPGLCKLAISSRFNRVLIVQECRGVRRSFIISAV